MFKVSVDTPGRCVLSVAHGEVPTALSAFVVNKQLKTEAVRQLPETSGMAIDIES